MTDDQQKGEQEATGNPTAEVGSEGGSPGNVELERHDDIGTGSEAGETRRPVDGKTETIRRDETGIGRRSP